MTILYLQEGLLRPKQKQTRKQEFLFTGLFRNVFYAYSTIVTWSPLNTDNPNLFIICLIANWAFTEFPALSMGGAKAAIPNNPGSVPITPPPTPVFAGMPEV